MTDQKTYDFGLIYDFVLGKPLFNGCNKLLALSGFASGSFVQQVLMENPNLKLEIIIGLAKNSGISLADHLTYNRLMNELPDRFKCSYYIGPDGIHAKMYCWFIDNNLYKGIIGSPNFSWQGMIGYKEAAAEVNPNLILSDINSIKNDSISAISPDVKENLYIFTPTRHSSAIVSMSHGSPETVDKGEEITLSLLTSDGEIHERSGLNWGQRPGREPNQAYIPIQATLHHDHPGFFPDHGNRFTLTTDDGHSIVCVIAQANDKAIECPDNNSTLGEYFRNRIGVPLGSFINKTDLEKYGRTSVSISKLDAETYFMDFSNN